MANLMLVIGVVCAIAGLLGTYYNESVQEHWLSVMVMLYGVILMLCSIAARRLKL